MRDHRGLLVLARISSVNFRRHPFRQIPRVLVILMTLGIHSLMFEFVVFSLRSEQLG